MTSSLFHPIYRMMTACLGGQLCVCIQIDIDIKGTLTSILGVWNHRSQIALEQNLPIRRLTSYFDVCETFKNQPF